MTSQIMVGLQQGPAFQDVTGRDPALRQPTLGQQHPLDVTVHSSDRKGPPGRLSRQGPPVLRWALYEAGKTHARSSAPDHRYYAQVKDRCGGKRAALSEARKILRQACHILAELSDDALTAASDPTLHDTVTSPVIAPAPAGHTAAVLTRWGPPRPAPAEPLSAAAGPAPQGQADGLIRLSGRIPAGRGHPINHHVAGAAPKPRGPR